MSQLHHFDPAFTIAIWGGIYLSGWTDDMIEVTQDEPDWKTTSGPDDSVVVTRVNNSLAKAVLSFQAESPTNDLLSAKRLLGMTGMLQLGAFSLANLNSRTIVKSARAFIEGPPSIGIKRDSESRVWTLIMHQTVIYVGGAVY